MARRLFNLFVALDQMAWVVLTLGWGYPDETISSACYRYEQQGAWWAQVLRPLIDWIFFWEPDHCRIAYQAEVLRLQAPLTVPEAYEIVKNNYSPD